MNKLATFLGVGFLAIMAPVAEGALQISYSINGSVPVVCNPLNVSDNAGACGVIGPIGGVTINGFLATSNSPGTAELAQKFDSSGQITTTAAATVEFWIAAPNFTSPTTPPDIIFASNLSTTSTTGSGTADLTSCVDTNNDLAPPTATFCSPGIALSNMQAVFLGTDATSNTVTTSIASLGAPYSLTQHITLQLAAGTNMNVITSAVLTPIPEPTSVALFGGVLLMTGVAIRRKFAPRA